MSAELIETYRGTVQSWHCDHMGHMNVMWYVGKFDEATWNLFAAAGVTAAVRSAFLEVREKVARFVHEMRNAQSGEISAICVLTGVSMDAETRKSCPLPPEVPATRPRPRVRVRSAGLIRIPRSEPCKATPSSSSPQRARRWLHSRAS